MQYAYCLSGSKTRVQKMQIGEAMANAGVAVEAPVAGSGGCALVETNTAMDTLGITLDAAPTYNTAQQTNNVDPAAYVSVVTNPDAVFQCRLNGSATVDGTALVRYYCITASTDGVDIIVSATPTGSVATMTAWDDCLMFGYTGANAGIARKIAIADGTDISLAVAMPFDVAVGDEFIFASFWPGQLHYATFTTSLLEADNILATGEDTDNVNFRPVEVIMNDVGNNGLLNSYVNLITVDHAFGGGYTA